MVVAIPLERRFERRDDCGGALSISRLFGSPCRQPEMRVAVHVMPGHRFDHCFFGMGAAIVSVRGRRPPGRLLSRQANADSEQQQR